MLLYVVCVQYMDSYLGDSVGGKKRNDDWGRWIKGIIIHTNFKYTGTFVNTRGT